jgi:5-methylcytosine-specific restriction endonuclease McrA
MGSRFKGFPKKSPYEIRKKQRMSHLHTYAKKGKPDFEYDVMSRRAAFESYKNRVLPDMNTQKCYVCNSIPSDWHHIIYLSRSGWDHKNNLVPLCKTCHKRAHRYDPVRGNRITPRVKHLQPFKKPTVLIEFVPKSSENKALEEINSQ